MKISVYTDGAARGNPGHSGIGVVLLDERGEVVEEYHRYLGTATNNVAEYHALIAGLELAGRYDPCEADFYLDSELVVRQMLGVYRVKNETLAGFHRTARRLADGFKAVRFTHIPREKNKRADGLANRAIDTAVAGDN